MAGRCLLTGGLKDRPDAVWMSDGQVAGGWHNWLMAPGMLDGCWVVGIVGMEDEWMDRWMGGRMNGPAEWVKEQWCVEKDGWWAGGARRSPTACLLSVCYFVGIPVLPLLVAHFINFISRDNQATVLRDILVNRAALWQPASQQFEKFKRCFSEPQPHPHLPRTVVQPRVL